METAHERMFKAQGLVPDILALVTWASHSIILSFSFLNYNRIVIPNDKGGLLGIRTWLLTKEGEALFQIPQQIGV